MDAIVFGNVTLDVICQTIDDVPRNESVSFDHVTISPGGCGSNVAIGLVSLGINTALVCCIANDEAAKLLQSIWGKFGVDLRFCRVVGDATTAVSVGLVDSNAQPRFIHTPGANRYLNIDDIDLSTCKDTGIKSFHVAGFFVLPGLLDHKLENKFYHLRKIGIITSLDVVSSPRYWKPEYLWSCLPEIDYFMCNKNEAKKLTDRTDPLEAAIVLKSRGANTVLIKLGSEGCLVYNNNYSERIPAQQVEVVDTTGAGDAFAAGFLARMIKDGDLINAVAEGNRIGAKMVNKRGAIGGWL